QAGIVNVQNAFGVTNTFDVSVFASVTMQLLGGDDTVTNQFRKSLGTAVMTIIGGDNGTGSDRLIEDNVDDATVNLAATSSTATIVGTRTAAGGGGIFSTTITGIEVVTV